MDEAYDEPLQEGRGFLIDCASHNGFYEGGYARTVVLGEPDQELKRVMATIGTAWDAILEKLRPGVTFSQIRMLGKDIRVRHD